MPDKRVLTDSFLEAIQPPPEGKRRVVYDAKKNSPLAVRVTDTGHVSFAVIRRVGKTGHPTWRTIGAYPKMTLATARARAIEFDRLMSDGADPIIVEEERERERARKRADTVAAVAAEFVKRHVKRLRSAEGIEATLERLVLAKWRDKPITSIARRDVRELIDEVEAERGPYMARNTFALVRKLFRWAVARDEYGLEQSPCAGLEVKDLVGDAVARDRILTDNELRYLWRATTAGVADPPSKKKNSSDDDPQPLAYPFGPFFRLLLLSGQRRNEVAEMTWSEIDDHERVWLIPAQRMKGKRPHEVPLTKAMVELLDACREAQREEVRRAARHDERDEAKAQPLGEFVFSTTLGLKAISGFGKVKDRLDEVMATLQAKGEPTAATKPGRDSWRLHDLRRTARTGMAAAGIKSHVAERVLAHAQPGIEGVYDRHEYRDEKRAGLQAWQDRLSNIVGDTPISGDKASAPKVARLEDRRRQRRRSA